MIEAKGIAKSYQNHQALKALDLSIPEGSIFGLLGPNGAGKTTFIRILNQIIAPDQGAIFFNGEKLKPAHISQIGYLPEERGLYPKMKIGEQLLYLAQLKGLSKSLATERIHYWLDRFELRDRSQAKIEELSKGLAQKVQFIASVIHEPQLLILDEPFTGFDPVNTEHIKNEILRLNEEGATIIFSTHRMESVEELCENIVLINQGEKLIEGKLAQVKNDFRSGFYQVISKELWQGASAWQAESILRKDSLHQYRLKADESQVPELLDSLKSSSLVSFEVEVPSLNEIFIQSTTAHV